MPGWMIETGYKYAKVASLAWAEGNLGSESEVNAALAVEILLKSLLAEPVENELTGTAAEQFKITGKNPGHNLFELYKAIPADLRSKLGLVRHVNTFKERRTFSLPAGIATSQEPKGHMIIRCSTSQPN